MSTGQKRLDAIEKKFRAAKEKADELEKQKNALTSKMQAINSIKSRAEDNKRKILIGACVLAEMKRDEKIKDWINPLLDKFLTRDFDRRIFELPPVVPVVGLPPAVDLPVKSFSFPPVDQRAV